MKHQNKNKIFKNNDNNLNKRHKVFLRDRKKAKSRIKYIINANPKEADALLDLIDDNYTK